MLIVTKCFGDTEESWKANVHLREVRGFVLTDTCDSTEVRMHVYVYERTCVSTNCYMARLLEYVCMRMYKNVHA